MPLHGTGRRNCTRNGVVNLPKATITFSGVANRYLVLPPSQKPVFSVPFERDKQFVGREDILSQVEEQLQNKHRLSLHGLGGIGSWTLITYCYPMLTNVAENHKSQLNMHTDFVTTIPTATCSGYMLQMMSDLIRRIGSLAGK